MLHQGVHRGVHRHCRKLLLAGSGSGDSPIKKLMQPIGLETMTEKKAIEWSVAESYATGTPVRLVRQVQYGCHAAPDMPTINSLAFAAGLLG